MFKHILLTLILFVGISDSLASASPIPQDDAWVESIINGHFPRSSIGDEVGDEARPLLREINLESREWFKEMSSRCILGNDQNRLDGLRALSEVHPSLRIWLKEKMDKYKPVQSSLIMFLSRVSVESREWFDNKEVQYIDPITCTDLEAALNEKVFGIRTLSNVTSAEDIVWFERMILHYPFECMGLITGIYHGSRDLYERVLSLLIDQEMSEKLKYQTINEATETIFQIEGRGSFSWLSPRTDLHEPFLGEFLREVNRVHENLTPLDFHEIRGIFSRARDRVTENARVNPAVEGRPCRAMEIHFASALKLPDGDEPIELYKIVRNYLRSLSLPTATLVGTRTQLHSWIDTYAEEPQRAEYHRAVTKGYGSGGIEEISYSAEITRLLNLTVPYMATVSEAARKEWIFSALDESLTAYDGGDPLSCCKGIQERLTILGFDIEGIDPYLRSISVFSRQWMYITDAGTGGADAFVKAAIDHLTEDQKISLLRAEKPDQDSFNKMFMPAIRATLSKPEVHLLPIHVEVLMNDPKIQMRFRDSLAMHYEYDHHYASLVERVRDIETPEQRRALLAAATASRLAKVAPTPDGLN